MSETELLRGIVNNVSAMLAYWDADLLCRFANDAYRRWFGVSPSSLIGTHIKDLLGPPLFELNRPYIEAALRGEPQEFERTIPDPAGGPARHSLAHYIPDIADGKVRGFYVLVSDISEVKRAQLALAASEAKFAKMINLAGDAIIGIDTHHKIQIFNACAEETFGYTADEVLGRDVGDLLVTLPSTDSATRSVDGRSERVTGRRKNGDEFPAEATASKVEPGEDALVTILLHDITARLRAETEQRILAETGAVLASSLDYKETLKTIVAEVVARVADICVIDILSRDGKTLERVTVAHGAAEKSGIASELTQLHLDPRHTLGRDVFATGEPHIYEEMDDAFYRTLIQDEQHLRLVHALGPRSALAVPLVHGDLRGALIFGAEQPRRYSTADLPLATELARRAGIAISNARLYEAEQRATHARDEVLSIVAHDLRSPLNSIYLGAQLLDHELGKQANPRAREEVQSILRSTMWANRLIEDLLDVARIEGGGLVITPSNVAPRAVLDEVLKMERLVASAAGITLRQEIPDDLQDVLADRDRLIQVLENLIGNALKFTSPGGRVTVGATNEPGFVQFTVSDTGAGIPEANLERVFDRFWQASRTERRGAGLGLPICKGIVEKHGGRIWGTSSIGFGTTFHFTVPAVAASAQVLSEAG